MRFLTLRLRGAPCCSPLNRRPLQSIYRYSTTSQSSSFEVIPEVGSKIEHLPIKAEPIPIEPELVVDDAKDLAKIKRAAKLELRWVNNKLSLGQRVQQLLEQGKDELATEVTRLASAKRDYATVSWNHLIRDALERKPYPRVNRAFKLFNEMKKRSQFPDAFTLSIFLKGAAEHPDPAITISRITQVFWSMQASKSPVKPNNIHNNQMLNLCGRAGSMETLWKILTTLPEHGPAAPSSQTYNIVLSALRTKLDSEDLTDEQRASYIQTAIQIWGIAVERWCKGTITMDSWLVAGMTGVLASSPNWRHWVGAFELVEQTMGIPKFVNARGRKAGGSKEKEAGESEDAVVEVGETKTLLFPSVTDGSGPLQLAQGMELVQPTNHILQNLLYICENIRSKHAALYYWYKFTHSTQPYRCEPDPPVYKRLLGVLRLARSSKGSLDVIKNLSGGMTQDWGVYRLALAACARNLNRERAFDNALEIYKIRRENIPLPDLKAISRLLWVLDNSQDDNKTKTAIPMIAEDTAKAVSANGYGWVDPNKSSRKELDEARNHAAQIVTGVQGYIDRMIITKTLDAKVFSKTKPKLSQFMTEAVAKGYVPTWRSTPHKPNWRDGEREQKSERGDRSKLLYLRHM